MFKGFNIALSVTEVIFSFHSVLPPVMVTIAIRNVNILMLSLLFFLKNSASNETQLVFVTKDQAYYADRNHAAEKFIEIFNMNH